MVVCGFSPAQSRRLAHKSGRRTARTLQLTHGTAAFYSVVPAARHMHLPVASSGRDWCSCAFNERPVDDARSLRRSRRAGLCPRRPRRRSAVHVQRVADERVCAIDGAQRQHLRDHRKRLRLDAREPGALDYDHERRHVRTGFVQLHRRRLRDGTNRNDDGRRADRDRQPGNRELHLQPLAVERLRAIDGAQ